MPNEEAESIVPEIRGIGLGLVKAGNRSTEPLRTLRIAEDAEQGVAFSMFAHKAPEDEGARG